MSRDKKLTCKHFNGISNKCCDLSINYRQLVGGDDLGWGRRIPCTPPWPGDGPTNIICEKLEYPTAEELAEEERRIDELLNRLQQVQPLIGRLKTENKRRDSRGIAPCPICNNTLHWTIAAYNGHTSGRCETEDCISWIE